MQKVKISPSLMCANLLDLQGDLDIFKKMNIDYLHIDIMDGHYVPNFTLGIDFCKTVASYSEIPLDLHLMIENVDKYIPRFAQFGNAIICIHPEVSYHPIRSVQLIRYHGAKAGIAIDPAIPIECVKYILPYIDIVCVMTVNPGYSGQKLIPQTINKIKELSLYLKKNGISAEIEVDGNVSWENIPKMAGVGADILVVGTSSVFSKNRSLEENIKKLKKVLDDLESF